MPKGFSPLEKLTPEAPPAQEGAEMRPEAGSETAAETLHEGGAAFKQEEEVVTAPQMPAPSDVGQQNTVQEKDAVLIDVERVLEEGLEPFYTSLPDDAKLRFREKGEEAAKEISNMIRQVRVQAKRVLELIYTWLKVIPGVNKFFLEQEAKLKTDRIMMLAEERKNDTT